MFCRSEINTSPSGRILSAIAVLVVFAAVFSSCAVEHRLGRKYIKKERNETLLVIPADFIYKLNLTYQEPDPVNLISEEARDSVGFFRSKFLQHISDSVFLEKFYNAFIEGMTSAGYRIMLPVDSLSFREMTGSKWILNFAQLQMEEETKKYYYDTYDVDDNYYYKEYDLTTFGLNTWTEVEYQDAKPDQKRLLYLSGFIKEDFDGGFTYDSFDEKMYFVEHSESRITENDIYAMATASGRKHAELMLDYLMNDYIRRNMPQGMTRHYILHYEKMFKTLSTDVRERFEVLK